MTLQSSSGFPSFLPFKYPWIRLPSFRTERILRAHSSTDCTWVSSGELSPLLSRATVSESLRVGPRAYSFLTPAGDSKLWTRLQISDLQHRSFCFYKILGRHFLTSAVKSPLIGHSAFQCRSGCGQTSIIIRQTSFPPKCSFTLTSTCWFNSKRWSNLEDVHLSFIKNILKFSN